MDNEKLVKEQMKTISKLQDTINLLKFDISTLNKENNELKQKVKCRTNNIRNVRVELMNMKRKNDFSKINDVLAMLNAGWDEYYER